MSSGPTETSAAAIADLAQVREQAEMLLDGVEEGDRLDAVSAALIGLAIHASVLALDSEGTREYSRRALDAGAGPEQIAETLMLTAALGVHTLMQGSRDVAAVLRERGEANLDGPLDQERTELWERYVGEDPYWVSFEEHVPGFLEALLRQSPDSFRAFFEVCAVPWRTGTVPARTKELIALATDAMPAHRYLPGLRLHLLGAVRSGAGRLAIKEAIEIGAAAPAHRGVA